MYTEPILNQLYWVCSDSASEDWTETFYTYILLTIFLSFIRDGSWKETES